MALKQVPEKQQELLQAIVNHGWSVRQAERFATSVKSGIHETKAVHARVKTQTTETKRLEKRLGTPVHIKRMAKGGRLEITFKSDEELAKIIQHLAG